MSKKITKAIKTDKKAPDTQPATVSLKSKSPRGPILFDLANLDNSNGHHNCACAGIDCEMDYVKGGYQYFKTLPKSNFKGGYQYFRTGPWVREL